MVDRIVELLGNEADSLLKHQCRFGKTHNSGGASGENDLARAARTAVINKRAGGMGLISGRKAFRRPMQEGVELLHAIEDVYLGKNLTVA